MIAVNVQAMVFVPVIKKKEAKEDKSIQRGYLTYRRPHG